MEKTSPAPYRALQKHLDRIPPGFPASRTGADIRLLQHIFSPDQARIATCLGSEPRSLEQIHEAARPMALSPGQLQEALTAMVKKGGIEVRRINGEKYYANLPLVVGMYELQIHRLTPEFIRDFKDYTAEKPFGISFLSTPSSQMRTIPVNKSIVPELKLADYQRVSVLLDRADPPFVILPCICRRKKQIQGQHCKKTQRTETCLAMGHVAQTLMEMGVGREIHREEARDIIRQNQEDGLVLQPANTRQVEFICSCCGCCCSMLGLQKDLPLPLDFWTADFRIRLDKDRCVGCGKCIESCQTLALTPAEPPPQKNKEKRPPRLNPVRCIGCGLCVPSCPSKALELNPSGNPVLPPPDRDTLTREFTGSGPGILRKAGTVAKLAKGILLTGDVRLLKSDPDP